MTCQTYIGPSRFLNEFSSSLNKVMNVTVQYEEGVTQVVRVVKVIYNFYLKLVTLGN